MAANPKTHCNTCESRAYGLLCDLGQNELSAIDAAKFEQKYKPGQNLFYSGNAASGLYCVVSGTVKLEMQDESGKTQIMQVQGAGSLIGYRALFSDQPYVASAVAVDPVHVCFIPKTAVLKLVQENPPLALKFLSQLSEDFRMMEQRLQRASSNSAPERIAEALLFLRENFEEKNWTRKEIAEWAGTTPETVMRTLADLEGEGIIEQTGRKITIKDRAKLLERAKIFI